MRKFTLLLAFQFIFVFGFSQLQTSISINDIKPERNSKELALYDQFQPSITGIASQQFPDFSNSRLQVADDFTIPQGEAWNISRVEIFGITNSGLPIPAYPSASFIIEVYEDAGGLPSATPLFVQDDLSFTENAGVYSVVLNTPLTVLPGDYWICIMPNMSFTDYGQLFVGVFQDAQITNKFAVQDPDLLLAGLYPQSWDYGDYVWAYPSYNLTFAIYGEETPVVPTKNWALLMAGLLIVSFTILRIKFKA